MARRSLRRAVHLAVFCALVAGLILALQRPRVPRQPGPGQAEARSGVVSLVYDGDTLDVRGVGKVRILGIDAMDGHNAEKMASQSRWYGLTTPQVKHWAEEATALAVDRLQGRRVVLHFGPERLDDYGRTLAYVDVSEGAGEQDFGLLLLKRGLAATFRKATHPRREEYFAAERSAQDARKGMWKDARVRP
jgi:micrococcal nuclease